MDFALKTQQYNTLSEVIKVTDSREKRKMQNGLSEAEVAATFSKWAGAPLQEKLTLDRLPNQLNRKRVNIDEMISSEGNHQKANHIFWEGHKSNRQTLAEGYIIRWGQFPSLFGDMLVLATDQGLCGLGFLGPYDGTPILNDFKCRWRRAEFHEDIDAVAPIVTSIFQPRANIPLHVWGTKFQIRIWRQLLKIPFGHLSTYSDLARVIGMPKASRAVGNAVGQNPISWLIPCHRVLRLTGELGGYRWGKMTKRLMLAWETAQVDGHIRRKEEQAH